MKETNGTTTEKQNITVKRGRLVDIEFRVKKKTTNDKLIQ